MSLDELRTKLAPDRLGQLRRLLAHPSAGSGAESLVDAVDRHTERLRSEALGAPVDLRLLDELSSGLMRLIREERHVAPELVEAAVRYFSWTGDAESDVELGGLDDDLEVFNAVAEALDRLDLVVAI